MIFGYQEALSLVASPHTLNDFASVGDIRGKS